MNRNQWIVVAVLVLLVLVAIAIGILLWVRQPVAIVTTPNAVAPVGVTVGAKKPINKIKPAGVQTQTYREIPGRKVSV